jgi:two-component system, chemotaxis family, chemotaxis protein CheY
VRAVIIDDCEPVRALLRIVLDRLGYEVELAGDGLEGLERLRGLGAVDLVLVDWHMPNMDGIEFMRTVRAERCYDAVWLVMVTSESDATAEARARAAGADAFVTKPFTMEKLTAAVRTNGAARWPVAS